MKKIVIFCAALIVSGFVFTQSSDAQSSSDRFTGSLLWKISGNGLAKPSHILGLYHLGLNVSLKDVDGAQKALKGSSQAVVELPDAQMGEYNGVMARMAPMPAGAAYSNMLSKEDYDRLDQTLKAVAGRGMEFFGNIKPGMVMIQLTAISFMNSFPDINPMTSVTMETEVERYAAGKKMAVIGLETPENQVRAMFDYEPVNVQAEGLACTARNWESYKQSVKNMVEFYGSADIAAMYSTTFGPGAPCPTEGQRALIGERNDRWLEKLPSIMSDGPAFIAVGVMNLPGEEGMLARLEKMGYTVEAVVK